MSVLNDSALENMRLMSVTVDTSHFERSPLNDFAARNIAVMVVAVDTSHFEMSSLNESAYEKMVVMSLTLDTFHSPIGPCGPLKQSPCWDILRHTSTALLSCALDCGENAGLVAHAVPDIDPGEPANMSFLLAVE